MPTINPPNPTTSNPPTRFQGQRRAPHRWRIFGALALLLVQIGCAASNSAPEITDSPYSGPQIHLDRESDFAHVLFHAPTPGWRVGVDRVDESFKRRDIFVTIQPPDPAYMTAQVIVEQRVATVVDRTVTARLFARVVAASPAQPDDRAYSLVESSGPVRPSSEADDTLPPTD